MIEKSIFSGDSYDRGFYDRVFLRPQIFSGNSYDRVYIPDDFVQFYSNLK